MSADPETLEERLFSMVDKVAEAIAVEQATARTPLARRLGPQARRTLARTMLDVVRADLGVRTELDVLLEERL